MTAPMKRPKKLIEVALPLDEINAASKREKSIRHGHPSTLHLFSDVTSSERSRDLIRRKRVV